MIQEAVDTLSTLIHNNSDKIGSIQINNGGIIIVRRPLGRVLVFGSAVQLLEFLE